MESLAVTHASECYDPAGGREEDSEAREEAAAAGRSHRVASGRHDSAVDLAPRGGGEAPRAKGQARLRRQCLSRVIREAIRYVAYEEGRDALIASFGRKGSLTRAEGQKTDYGFVSATSSPTSR